MYVFISQTLQSFYTRVICCSLFYLFHEQDSQSDSAPLCHLLCGWRCWWWVRKGRVGVSFISETFSISPFHFLLSHWVFSKVYPLRVHLILSKSSSSSKLPLWSLSLYKAVNYEVLVWVPYLGIYSCNFSSESGLLLFYMKSFKLLFSTLHTQRTATVRTPGFLSFVFFSLITGNLMIAFSQFCRNAEFVLLVDVMCSGGSK